LDDEPRIPKLIGSAGAVHTLPLAAVDGFVLSRIDGKASDRELSALTGLSVDQVRSSLEKLESLHVITLLSKGVTPVPPVSPSPAPTSAKPRSADSKQPAPASPPPGSPSPSTVAASSEDAAAPFAQELGMSKRLRAAMAIIPPDAAELTEDVDLAGPFRMRILGAYSALSSLDYYELLGLERAADKKGVKRAYFELAALFHPDRYFRKRLGSFKLKMETLFGTVTEAYDTLSDKGRRAEYDTYLIDLDRTRGVEDLLKEAAEEARRAEEDALRIAERTSSDVPVDGAPARSVPPDPNGTERKPSGFYSSVRTLRASPPAQGAPTATTPASLPPLSAAPSPSASLAPLAPGSPIVTDRARRDALAMRLRGNRTLSRSTSNPPPGPRVSDGGEGLKRRYEDRVAQARKAQAEKYVALAREAESKSDLVGAAAAYRVTLGFLSEGDPIRAVAQAAIAKADAALAETYLRQAMYEERSEHWPDAAKSWQRVAKGLPDDARAHERAANAMAKAHGDLHVAAELAKRAIAIDPQNADYKITLAAVFIQAGLGLNARRELEAAAQLSPRNATIQALLKTVNKAG
jgi:curved DNA-binding protein CbpA